MTQTLEQALRATAMERWQGKRCYATNMSQAQVALRDVSFAVHERKLPNNPCHDVVVSEVSPEHVQHAVAFWYREGLSPATIQKRLNCLSAMGVNVSGAKVKKDRSLKWWLNPQDEERLLKWLRGRAMFRVCDFIRWTTGTGLRVEETLRVTWGMIDRTTWMVTVPGLKTAESQATLPLSTEVVTMLRAKWEALDDKPGDGRDKALFPWTYEELRVIWEECRKFLGASDNPFATLKALRRSAARKLHIQNGMPLDMVRQYLRHENIQTTMEYLRLTGGYGTEEFRRWLK